MQDAGTASRFRILLMGLAVPGSLLSMAAVPLAGWGTGVLLYTLVVTTCLAMLVSRAGVEPVQMHK